MKTVHLAIAGSLIVASTMAGMYAVAASAATTLAATLTTAETSRHAQSVEFAAMLSRASVEHGPTVNQRQGN